MSRCKNYYSTDLKGAFVMGAKEVLYIVSGVMFLVGFLVIFFAVRKKQRCTEPAVAEIVDIKRSEDVNDNGKTSYSYSPVVEFTVGVEKIRKTASVSSRKRKAYKIGDQIEIKFNPLKPKEFIAAKQKSGFFGGALLMLIAVGIAVTVLIFG